MSKYFDQKVNQQQLDSLKANVKTEATEWKNSMIQNEWCIFGPEFKIDKLDLQLQRSVNNNENGSKTDENYRQKKMIVTTITLL